MKKITNAQRKTMAKNENLLKGEVHLDMAWPPFSKAEKVQELTPPTLRRYPRKKNEQDAYSFVKRSTIKRIRDGYIRWGLKPPGKSDGSEIRMSCTVNKRRAEVV